MNVFKIGTVALFVLLQSCSSLVTGTTATKLVDLASTSSSETAKYEIRWNGAKDQELEAIYVVTYDDFQKPQRIEQVKARLPHTVTFPESGVSNVLASGLTWGNSQKLEIKIYRNGSECGKPIAVGSGAGDDRICQL